MAERSIELIFEEPKGWKHGAVLILASLPLFWIYLSADGSIGPLVGGIAVVVGGVAESLPGDHRRLAGVLRIGMIFIVVVWFLVVIYSTGYV